MSKTIQDYAIEMTKEEFLNLSEVDGICPYDLGLDAKGNCNRQTNEECNKCMRNAVSHITFKQPVAIMEEYLPVLQQLQQAELQYNQLDDQRKTLKEQLQQVMESNGITKWENDEFSISYVAEGKPSTTLDSTKVKKKYPDIYEDCCKPKAGAKAHVKFNIKK